MKKIGVIGLGSIGMRHAKNLIELGCSVYGYDPSHLAQKIFKDAGGFTVDNPTELTGLDGIVIATPTKMHHLDAMASMVVMKTKNIFIEKPVAESAPKATIIQSIAKKKGVNIMVGHNLRFHPCVKLTKKLLPNIGDIIWSRFTVSQHTYRDAYLRDGVLLNWAIHEIDIALFLLGPASVKCAYGDEGMVDAIIEHNIGVVSTIHADYYTRPEVRGFSIGGTMGNIFVDIPTRIFSTQPQDGVLHGIEPGGSFDDDYQDEMRAFLDIIDGKPNVGATLEEGVAAVRIAKRAEYLCNNHPKS